MDYRDELVHLIADGIPPPEIVRYFLLRGFHPKELEIFLRDCGVFIQIRKQHNDGISDERRRELQELSTQDD